MFIDEFPNLNAFYSFRVSNVVFAVTFPPYYTARAEAGRSHSLHRREEEQKATLTQVERTQISGSLQACWYHFQFPALAFWLLLLSEVLPLRCVTSWRPAAPSKDNHLMSHAVFPLHPWVYIWRKTKRSLQLRVCIKDGGGCVMAAAEVNH